LTIVVLLVLAIVWAAVLIPPWLRNRAEGRPSQSIGAFRRQLTTLGRTRPGAPARDGRPAAGSALPAEAIVRAPARVPGSRRQTRKRRRDVLLVLAAAMVATLVAGLVLRMAPVLIAHAVVDALFLLYIALLVRMRGAAVEREMKLRFLPTGAQQMEPALALRRSAN
jgi:hypothetical protein